MLLCCCEPCTPCPCKTPPTSLHVDFSYWSSSSPAYCNDCSSLNGLFEIPKVTSFSAVLPIGSIWNFFGSYPPCTSEQSAGEGCHYELEEEFDCSPAACYTCAGGCGESCTADTDCAKENCDPDFYSCGALSPDCDTQGGGICDVDCSTYSICVFDDEFDPDHLNGVCTMVSCTVAAVTSCTPLRRVTRVIIYTASDGKPVISFYSILFGINTAGELCAITLGGSRKFDNLTEFDCVSLGHDITMTKRYISTTSPPCDYTTLTVNVAA